MLYIVTKNRQSVVNVTGCSFYIHHETNGWMISSGKEGLLIENLGCYKTIEDARGALLDISKFLEDEKTNIFAMPR